MIILEEVNLPHQRCSRCDMLVPWRALNIRHNATAMCKKGPHVVVDVVVCHWVTMALDEADNKGERGDEGRHQVALFYTDDGMVASSNPRWLQWAFDALVGLFEWVGLRTNCGNTFSMVCRTCQAEETQSIAAYGRKMTGEGPTYRERKK